MKPSWLVPAILLGYSFIFGIFKWKVNGFTPPLYFLTSALLVIVIFPHVFKSMFGASFSNEVIVGMFLGLLPLAAMAAYEQWLPSSMIGSTVHYTKMAWINLLLFAPLGEELYFRGLLQPHLRERLPLWAAISFQALLFMFCHATWALGPLMLGIVNGILFAYRKDVRACIVLHVLSNLYGPTMLKYFPQTFERLRFFYY